MPTKAAPIWFRLPGMLRYPIGRSIVPGWLVTAPL
jgi:hypothetical protein